METILLVEGELHQQQLYSEELQDAGWQVICVASSEEALQTVKTNPVDCVVLDAKLPCLDNSGQLPPFQSPSVEADTSGSDEDDGENGNGTCLLGQIRRHWPLLPVIIYTTQTAATGRSAQKDLRQRGATACLLKNGDPSRLIAVVRTALRRLAAEQSCQMASPNCTNQGRSEAAFTAPSDYNHVHLDTRVDPYQDPGYNVPR